MGHCVLISYKSLITALCSNHNQHLIVHDTVEIKFAFEIFLQSQTFFPFSYKAHSGT